MPPGLVPPGGAIEMADAVDALLDHPEVRRHLARTPRPTWRHASPPRQVDAYLTWYRDRSLAACQPPPASGCAISGAAGRRAAIAAVQHYWSCAASSRLPCTPRPAPRHGGPTRSRAYWQRVEQSAARGSAARA
jgi:hypothetical protein